MRYTLGQAAKRLKMNKSTLSRHRREGRFSAEKDENGAYVIEESELARAYPEQYSDTVTATAQSNDAEHSATLLDNGPELAALRAENALLRDERDDLRRRLDAEADERRRLTMLLTDQRPREGGSQDRAGWLDRLFGRK